MEDRIKSSGGTLTSLLFDVGRAAQLAVVDLKKKILIDTHGVLP